MKVLMSTWRDEHTTDRLNKTRRVLNLELGRKIAISLTI